MVSRVVLVLNRSLVVVVVVLLLLLLLLLLPINRLPVEEPLRKEEDEERVFEELDEPAEDEEPIMAAGCCWCAAGISKLEQSLPMLDMISGLCFWLLNSVGMSSDFVLACWPIWRGEKW